MEQLTEMDYGLLQMENERIFQHIAVAMIYDQASVAGGVRFEQIKKWFQSRLPVSKVFRRRLAGDTGGLDTPYWIEDADFDLEYHMRSIALPHPGDWRQFCVQMARLHAQPLDLSRPPWEAYVIEGLDNVEGLPENSFAIFLKIHHAAVDGIAITQIIDGLHSLAREAEALITDEDWEGEPEPTPRELWSRALSHTISRPKKLGTMLKAGLTRSKSDSSGWNKPGAKQTHSRVKTRFNAAISPHRVVEAITLDLDQVKALRQAVDGVTVNDAIVTVVGGAMRKYLLARHELPDESLSAGAPVGLPGREDGETRGNQLGIIWIKLGTDIDDPLERLQRVSASASQSKAELDAGNPRMMMDFSESVGPFLFAQVARLGRLMPQHTVVSNVPGPRVPYYLAGAELQSLLALGPISDGIGLFHGVISCGRYISITAVSCRDIMPDPQFYRECLREAWDELHDAVGANAVNSIE